MQTAHCLRQYEISTIFSFAGFVQYHLKIETLFGNYFLSMTLLSFRLPFTACFIMAIGVANYHRIPRGIVIEFPVFAFFVRAEQIPAS